MSHISISVIFFCIIKNCYIPISLVSLPFKLHHITLSLNQSNQYVVDVEPLTVIHAIIYNTYSRRGPLHHLSQNNCFKVYMSLLSFQSKKGPLHHLPKENNFNPQKKSLVQTWPIS